MTGTGCRLIRCLGVLLPLVLAVAAAADEVRLKNGDRLTGDIVRLEDELLTFKPSYTTDALTIDWKEVACIVSTRPLPFAFSDNEFLLGTISCPESGSMQIDSSLFGKTAARPLDKLLAVNPSTYSGLFSLGGSLNSGNTDTMALHLATRFQVKTHKHRFTIDARFNYGETDGKESVRNSSGSLKYDFFALPKIYSYAQSLTEEDAFANLNLRNTEGLGIGYQFFDSRRLSLFTEAGISFFNEDVKVGEDKRDAALRWAAGIDWEARSKRFKLFHRQEGYYRFAAAAVVLRLDQGIRLPLRDGIAANIEADYRFTSAPDAGKQRSDLALVFGFTYEYAYW